MGTLRVKTMACLAAAMLAAGADCGVSAASADDKSSGERRQEQANKIRERAKTGARINLDYEDIFPSLRRYDYDPYLLSQQMARLSALIGRFADEAARLPPGWIPLAAVHGPGGRPLAGSDDVVAIYGPKGPTVESVKLLLDYNLMVADNPRLRAGPIRDMGETVTAKIVTKEGNVVVEEYVIDKKTGVWSPVR